MAAPVAGGMALALPGSSNNGSSSNASNTITGGGSASAGGGLLHEFRKKTMQKIVKYAAASPVSSPLSPTSSGASVSAGSRSAMGKRAVLSPRARDDQPSPTERMAQRIARFDEHDGLLRQLEVQLGEMLQQIQSACLGMGRVVEVFTQTFRYDHGAYQVGIDYLAAMKMIRREVAHLMEQAVRFTVLDPLASRLERHEGVKLKIATWQRALALVEEEQLATDFLRVTRPDKEEKRAKAEARLAKARDELNGLTRELTQLLDGATNGAAVKHQADLFTTMRLQLAIFFYQTNQTLFARLSETETEIVRGVGPPLVRSTASTEALRAIGERALEHEPDADADATTTMSTSARNSKTTLTASGFSDHANDYDDDDHGSRPEDEEARVSITLEDFERGKGPNDLSSALPHVDRAKHRVIAAIAPLPLPDLLALASHPVIDALPLTAEELEPRLPPADASRATSAPKLLLSTAPGKAKGEAGVLSSLRKSFHDKFGSPKAVDTRAASFSPTHAACDSTRGITTPASTTSTNTKLETAPLASRPVMRKRASRLVMLSGSEWDGVEASLWELDAEQHRADGDAGVAGSDLACAALSRTKSRRYSANANVLAPRSLRETSLPELLCNYDKVLYACTGFLRLDAIARLCKADRRLHERLRRCPAVWKRSIRVAGPAPSMRSAVWLAVLYGGTPWQSATVAPHHLCSGEMRRRIYENLLVKLGARIAEGLLRRDGGDVSDEDAPLVAWLHEIDVDVARTCNKDIYAQDVAEEWDASFGLTADGTSSNEAVSSLVESMVASALGKVAESPDKSPSPQPHSQLALLHRHGQSGINPLTRRTQLETNIRRVLRAYVMYNPRVGYCQGMNFLVRLLMEVAEDEADCFWLFVGLSEPANDRNLYEPGLAVLQPLFARFEACLARQKPELHAHLEREGVPVAAYTARWFLTFFSTFETFGPSLVIRVLDLFVVDGWRIVFGMALVVLDELEEQLLAADMEDLFRILQFPRAHLHEPDHARRRQLLRHALAFSITRAMTEHVPTD